MKYEERIDQLRQHAMRLTKPEEQEEKTFEKFTSLLRVLPDLTNEQLSVLGFEVWNDARVREPI